MKEEDFYQQRSYRERATDSHTLGSDTPDMRRHARFLTPSGRTQSTVHRNALPCAMPAPPNPHPSSSLGEGT
jgi:hypothetical protein